MHELTPGASAGVVLPRRGAVEPRGGAVARLDGVTVSLGGKVVLHGLDLIVRAGEAVALVGPSGAGKTTALRALGAALAPDRGRVWIEGQDVLALGSKERRRARSRVGFVHQQLALVPQLRVHQNVAAGRFGRVGLLSSLRATLFPSRRELIEMHTLTEQVGVAELLFRRTDTLSGGQQQRVAIARALYQEPVLLLADEPVASVDPERARAVVELLLALCRERGLALVVSLHDLDLAREHFDRLVGLRGGHLAFDAPAHNLADDHFARLYELERGDTIP
ncbi:MAG: ATP-binding cassette domain-containing protein [Planctomycetaceae bacterium]|nr:ATP-binding cassette domain-containing protein [Planctomycetaceae bacterium]